MDRGLRTCRGLGPSGYVAGCNEEYRGECYETMEDHIRRMVDKYRELGGGLRRAAVRAYEAYVEELERLVEKLGRAQETGLRGSRLVGMILRCGPVELVIALHDVGKCTLDNQERLRSKCTSPLHEVVSAAYLYSVAVSLDRTYGALASMPLILGILMHHHASRSLEEVLRRAVEIRSRVKDEDCECVSRCADLGLELVCPELRDAINSARAECFARHIESVRFAVEKIHRELPSLEIKAYRVAITVSGILSLLDRYSAGVNRSCGRSSEKDLGRDIREFLVRRGSFVKAGEKLREVFGV